MSTYSSYLTNFFQHHDRHCPPITCKCLYINYLEIFLKAELLKLNWIYKNERSNLMLVSIFLSHRWAHPPYALFFLFHSNTCTHPKISFVFCEFRRLPTPFSTALGVVTLQWVVLDSGSNPVAMSAVQSRPKSVPETDYGHLLSNPERRWCHEPMERKPAWNHKKTGTDDVRKRELELPTSKKINSTLSQR